MKLLVYTDGGARGNPGPAATGVVLCDTAGTPLKAYGEYLGVQTNNYAEYRALISALECAQKMGATEVACYADSKLVVEQLNRRWKVKHPEIQKLFIEAWNALQQFDRYTISYIPREKNTAADAEVNKALDAAL